MTLNPSNPQRGTGVRKQATGVRPAVPAPAPAAPARPATGRVPAAAPPPAPVPAAPGAGRSTGVRPAPSRPGAPAAGRAPLRSAAAPKQGGKGTKYLMLTIIILLVGMVAYCFIPLGGKPPLAIRLARMWGLMKKPTAGGEAATEDPAVVGLDGRYKAALAARERAQAFLTDQEQKYKDSPQTLTEVDIKHVVDDLEKYRDQVYLGVDDIGKVVTANGKDTTISADVAKEEQKKQKAAANDLGKALIRWKGSKDLIFAKSDEFVTQKFNPTPAPDPKPAEKRDPRSLLTVVAPATPNDTPKPPDPPKEDPKPVEPKPEPEKPKPEPEKPKEDPKPEPKTEPEKPKPAEPKPEPEKPKEDPKPEPKPEPEKPKPAESKPEPEKPKEDPKPAEPKPEPEKPKEEPKPEPKAETKPKIDTVLAEAEKLVLDGSPMAKEVIGAARNLPADPEKLKTLSMKAETAQAFFVKAKDTYIGIKDGAPEAADIPGKIAKIEKILALLQNAAEAINSKK
jgi:hypothetical protein